MVSHVLRNKALQIISVFGFLSPLLVFVYNGFQTRYIADDYCTAIEALQRGLPSSVLYWYQNWAGQFTNFTLKGIAAYLGSGIASLLPCIIVLLWLATTIWTFYQLAQLLSIKQPIWFASVMGSMMVYAIFAGVPSIIQSLYWLGATIPYSIPVTFLIFCLGFLIYVFRLEKRVSNWVYVFIGLLTLVASGTSEVSTLFQIAVLGLVILIIWFFGDAEVKKKLTSLIVLILLFSILGLLITLSAPGNAIRQAAFPPPLPLLQAIERILLVSLGFTTSALIQFAPIPLLITMLTSMLLMGLFSPIKLLQCLTPTHIRKMLVLSPIVAFALIVMTIAPTVYATSVAPAARVYIIPHLVLVCMAILWGGLMGLGLRLAPSHNVASRPSQWVITSMLLILIVIGPVVAAVRGLLDTPAYQLFATEWDRNDREIRVAAANGEQHIKVRALDIDLGGASTLEMIGADSNTWINQCAARYYGVQSLSVYELKMADKTNAGL